MVYDAQNRRRTVTDRVSGVTTYALNAGGQLTALTDAESQTTSYTYNARGEKTEEQYPDHTSGSPGDATYGKILFAYDPAGRLSRRDDQNGDTVTHSYDMAGRLLQKDYRTRANSPTGTIADSDTFTYDRSGRMLTAVSGRYSNTVTNTYDVAGRLKDESLTIATRTYTVSRTYDSLGRLFQMTYPNSTVVERTYTDRNQLYTVKYGANIEDTRSYDDGGRLSTSAYRNGVTTTYNYRDVSGDKDNLLASIQFAHPGGTATNRQVGDLTYTWDANKNKTKETIAGTLAGYSFDTTLGADPDGYDDEDRITYFKRSNTTNPQTWTLTSVGDWSSWNNFSTTAETRTHGAAHELTRIGSGTTPATISYDVKGNITQNQRTPGTSSTYQNYVWDFDNRMISADTNGDSTADVTYEYDALGRRVARTDSATDRVYIHAGQQVVCDYTRGSDANTTPAFRYVWGDYIDEPILRQTGSTTLLYYHHNQQYSTVALTNSSGEVISRYGYTAYGEQSILTYTGSSQSYSSYANRYTYTGREWDDSLKAHYFRARWYDAPLGRFVNRDPIGYVDGMSLYGGYFANVGLDPQGTRIGIVDASFVDHSNASGVCGDPYSWEQRLDIYWIGIPKGKNRYGFAEIFGISVRNGAIVQNVRHEFSCASCDCPMDVVSGEFNFWEWFGMEIPPDRFNLPGKWSVGPFESRLYGTDIHFMQYAPPVTNFPDPQLVCFSSIRVTTYLGTTFGTNGWWGPLAFPFPQNVPDWVNTGHVPQGIAFPEDRGHDWGFDVSCVGGRCIRVNKFGF